MKSSRETCPTPTSVNWHVWPFCNYRCRFCFTTFKHAKRALPLDVALIVPGMLAEAGTEKISFAGGEPTLCPFLTEMLRESKDHGLTTMVISNGTGLTEEFLSRSHKWIDWIALSIDSSSPVTEQELGRGNGDHLDRATKVWELLEYYGIRRKLNTVITSLNWHEDMSSLIEMLVPERWKVFQVLPIRGENGRDTEQLSVSRERFVSFVENHAQFNPVAENNDAMTDSYLMMDPTGRFFQNTSGQYSYSSSVFDVGVESAIREVGWSQEKFNARGGIYEWHKPLAGEGG
ncbi:MAG: viperin family antiviral radical SAM protein [Candidatus Thorarchaeota archaeon]